MINFFRKLMKDRRGNTIVIVAAVMPLIVGASGLASDTIQWTLWKRQLQRAADSAAISGAYTRFNASGSTTDVASSVSHDLTLNMHNWMGLKSGFPVVQYDANCTVAGSTANITNRVCVTVAVQQKLPFSSMFMASAPTITAVATAGAIPAGGDPCFFATEPGTATGLNFSGNSEIDAPDCDGFSNASGANTSVAKGSSTVKINTIGGVGGIQQSNNFQVTAYRPYSPAMTDPFKNVDPDPTQMKCAGHWETKGKKSEWVYDSLTDGTDMGAAKAQDGSAANCWKSLDVGSNTSLSVPSDFGPIYIDGGDATIQGNFSCSACTIVLTNKDSSSPIGSLKVNAGANMNISSPTTGTFKGIAIYQDRRASDCNNCNKLNGHNASVVQGAIYFPSQPLDYNGTGTTNAICTMFIARRLDFSGNSGISNKFKKLADCGAFGIPNGSNSWMVRLVG